MRLSSFKSPQGPIYGGSKGFPEHALLATWRPDGFLRQLRGIEVGEWRALKAMMWRAQPRE
eukprot:1220990-Pyramimonas_sp.AAC.1